MSDRYIHEELHFVDNAAGWKLGMKRVSDAKHSKGRPALLIPGYGMNAFIFGFHPNGTSLERFLAEHGIEVWSLDFRAQGRSIRTHGNDRAGFAELALHDLGVAIDYVLAHTRTNADRVDLIGCSLGTALMFAHVASIPSARVGSLVSMAGLVTWEDVPLIVRGLFASPKLAGAARLRGTRTIARVLLPPLAQVAPRLLGLYLNERSTDISQPEILVRTVEDPIPQLNREIGEWVKRRELIVKNVNVSRKLADLTHPFLGIVANQDGIVPPATSRAIYDGIGSPDKELLLLGDDEWPIGHADVFLARRAHDAIFPRIASFLTKRH